MNQRLVADTCFLATKFVKHIGGVTIVDEFTAKAQIDEDLAYSRFDPPIQFLGQSSLFGKSAFISTVRRFS